MITGIGHTAYACTDLDAALDFYVTKLGCEESFRLYHDDGSTWIVYIKVAGRSFVELFPGAQPAEVSGSTGGYRHLCLEVDDMAATLAECAARGLVVNGEPNRGKDGNLQYWITDPDGNRIELMELAPDSLQSQAIRA